MKDRHSRPPRQNRNAAMLNGWPVDRQDPVESGRFYPLHAPEAFGDPVLARLPAEVASRTAGLLERLGQSGADGEQDRLFRDDPWLSGLYAASVSGRVATGTRAGRRVQTAGVERNSEEESPASGPRCANVAGFSVHANVAIREHRRDALERLCRDMCRPPAEEALHRILECLGLPSRAPPLSPARRSDIVSAQN